MVNRFIVAFQELVMLFSVFGLTTAIVAESTKRVGKPRVCASSRLPFFRALLLCFCFLNVSGVDYDHEITVTKEEDSDTYDCVTSGSTTCNLRGAINRADSLKPSPVLCITIINIYNFSSKITF